MKTILTISLLLIIALVITAFMVFNIKELGASSKSINFESFSRSQHLDLKSKKFINRRQSFWDKEQKKNFSLKGLFSMTKEFFSAKHSKPAKALPADKVDLEEFLKPSSKAKFVWLGHSTFLINIDSKIVLVDPVLSDYASPVKLFVKRFQRPALSLTELPRIDLILISHDHYDHLDMQSIQFFKDKEAKFLVPLGVDAHLKEWGIEQERITAKDWWENHIVDDVEFIATPAQHFSGRGTEQNKTLWASWVIRNEDNNIYFSGDSGYDIHFKQIGEKYGPFDIAFMENGQYNKKWQFVHMLPEESAQAYFDLKAKSYFPIHWGSFVLSIHSWFEPIEKIYNLSVKRGINLIHPKIGELYQKDQAVKPAVWWRDQMPNLEKKKEKKIFAQNFQQESNL